MISNYPVYVLHRSPPFSHLWQVLQPPKSLFIQGDPHAINLLKELPERGLSVVGTRKPQLQSIELLRKSIGQLRHSSLIILSGLAQGIDSVAHESAIEAGLPTIALLGTGLDQTYPKSTRPTRERILRSGGLLVSEFPMGDRGYPSHFLKRNRLIAGWSKATWIVEASQPSGTLNTARWAREMGKTCFVTPCFPGEPGYEGNQRLLDDDHALAFWGAHSLGACWLHLASLPHWGEASHARTRVPSSPDEKTVT